MKKNRFIILIFIITILSLMSIPITSTTYTNRWNDTIIINNKKMEVISRGNIWKVETGRVTHVINLHIITSAEEFNNLLKYDNNTKKEFYFPASVPKYFSILGSNISKILTK